MTDETTNVENSEEIVDNSTSSEITDVENSEEIVEERSISDLVLLSYKEMTEEEIERVVEWKAQNAAREAEFEYFTAERETLHELYKARLTEIADRNYEKLQDHAEYAHDRFAYAQELREQVDALKAQIAAQEVAE